MSDTLKLAQTQIALNGTLRPKDNIKLAAAYIDLHKRMEKIAEEAGLGNPEAIHPESLLGRILALTKGTK